MKIEKTTKSQASVDYVADASHLFREPVSVTGEEIAYSHEYERYLDFFKLLAHCSERIAVTNVPRCWIPFIRYLGHRVRTEAKVWTCDTLDWSDLFTSFYQTDPRRAVEIASECRPELVHALYLADTEWPCFFSEHKQTKEFVVTGNGSLHRPEIFDYIKQLHSFKTDKTCAVLCPCAADKPYPSKLHREIERRLPDKRQWHIIVTTGVLGLVPQELWDTMPIYDSGLPYQHRVSHTVSWYFQKHRYKKLVIYSDFYAEAIRQGLGGLRINSFFVFGDHYRNTYENLLLSEHLQRLEQSILYNQ